MKNRKTYARIIVIRTPWETENVPAEPFTVHGTTRLSHGTIRTEPREKETAKTNAVIVRLTR